MKYAFAQVAFGLGAHALVARDAPQCVQLMASGGVSGVLGQFTDGQNRIGGGYPSACYCFSNGGFTDSSGRGCILTPPTTQFQCKSSLFCPYNKHAANFVPQAIWEQAQLLVLPLAPTEELPITAAESSMLAHTTIRADTTFTPSPLQTRASVLRSPWAQLDHAVSQHSLALLQCPACLPTRRCQLPLRRPSLCHHLQRR